MTLPEDVSARTNAETASATDTELTALVIRMAEQDQRALERFYELTVRRVYTVAVRIVRSPQLAEEVVEDAFWQAWREAGRYEPSRGRVLTWLLTISRTRALDALRRRDPAEAHDDMDALRAGEVSEQSDPGDLLEAMERGSAVRAALETLKPQARQLVSLAYFRGLTQSEIAEACGLPLGTVKATLFRAYEQLRVCLTAGGLESKHE